MITLLVYRGKHATVTHRAKSGLSPLVWLQAGAVRPSKGRPPTLYRDGKWPKGKLMRKMRNYGLYA